MATTQQLTTPLQVILADITFADTGTTTIGYLPPGARLFQIKVQVTTQFDSGTSDVLTIGHGAYGTTAADPDEFEADVDLDNAAGDIAVTQLRMGEAISTTDTVPVTITYTSTGTAPTAGAATVIFTYIQP